MGLMIFGPLRYIDSDVFFLKEGSLYRLVDNQVVFVSEISDIYILVIIF